jgi:hypothetical protein
MTPNEAMKWFAENNGQFKSSLSDNFRTITTLRVKDAVVSFILDQECQDHVKVYFTPCIIALRNDLERRA